MLPCSLVLFSWPPGAGCYGETSCCKNENRHTDFCLWSVSFWILLLWGGWRCDPLILLCPFITWRKMDAVYCLAASGMWLYWISWWSAASTPNYFMFVLSILTKLNLVYFQKISSKFYMLMVSQPHTISLIFGFQRNLLMYRISSWPNCMAQMLCEGFIAVM